MPTGEVFKRLVVEISGDASKYERTLASLPALEEKAAAAGAKRRAAAGGSDELQILRARKRLEDQVGKSIIDQQIAVRKVKSDAAKAELNEIFQKDQANKRMIRYNDEVRKQSRLRANEAKERLRAIQEYERAAEKAARAEAQIESRAQADYVRKGQRDINRVARETASREAAAAKAARAQEQAAERAARVEARSAAEYVRRGQSDIDRVARETAARESAAQKAAQAETNAANQIHGHRMQIMGNKWAAEKAMAHAAYAEEKANILANAATEESVQQRLHANQLKYEAELAQIQRARIQALGQGMQKAGGAMTSWVTMPGLAAGIGSAYMSMQYKDTLAKIQGLTGTPAGEIENVSKQIKKLSVEVGRTPKELAEGYYFIASSGVRGAAALDVLQLSAKAAAAGLGSTKDIADMTTSAIMAFGDSGLTAAAAVDALVAAVREGKAEPEEFAHSMGKLLGIGDALHMSFQDLAAGVATLTRAGLDSDMGTTALRQMMTQIIKGVPHTVKALESIGLSVKDLKREMAQNLPKSLVHIWDAFGRDEDKMSGVFGNVRALTGALNMLAQEQASLQDLYAKVRKSAGDMQTAWSIMEKTPGSQFMQAIMQVGVAMIDLGDKMTPTILRLAEDIKAIGKWLDGLSPATKLAAMRFAAVAIAIGPLLTVTGDLLVIGGKVKPLLIGIAAGAQWLAVKLGIMAATEGTAATATMTLGTALKSLMLNPVTWALTAAVLAVEALRRQIVSTFDDIEERSKKLRDLPDSIKQANAEHLQKRLKAETTSQIQNDIKRVNEQIGEAYGKSKANKKEGKWYKPGGGWAKQEAEDAERELDRLHEERRALYAELKTRPDAQKPADTTNSLKAEIAQLEKEHNDVGARVARLKALKQDIEEGTWGIAPTSWMDKGISELEAKNDVTWNKLVAARKKMQDASVPSADLPFDKTPGKFEMTEDAKKALDSNNRANMLAQQQLVAMQIKGEYDRRIAETWFEYKNKQDEIVATAREAKEEHGLVLDISNQINANTAAYNEKIASINKNRAEALEKERESARAESVAVDVAKVNLAALQSKDEYESQKLQAYASLLQTLGGIEQSKAAELQRQVAIAQYNKQLGDIDKKQAEDQKKQAEEAQRKADEVKDNALSARRQMADVIGQAWEQWGEGTGNEREGKLKKLEIDVAIRRDEIAREEEKAKTPEEKQLVAIQKQQLEQDAYWQKFNILTGGVQNFHDKLKEYKQQEIEAWKERIDKAKEYYDFIRSQLGLTTRDQIRDNLINAAAQRGMPQPVLPPRPSEQITSSDMSAGWARMQQETEQQTRIMGDMASALNKLAYEGGR